MQRESLREDLEAKLRVVFHNYGLDLEASQTLYERHKEDPPVMRNAPPVAGNVMWARQLLRRIETPMSHFQENEKLMSTKESRKIVKTYNKIARTLVEFETLWILAWKKSVDTSKAGLHATLIIRHPTTGRLIVNFDREILLLIRETKCLMRVQVPVPEGARLVVLQEKKFKAFFNSLTFVLHRYEQVLERIIPTVVGLLKPHVADMERKLQPGMTTLTWTSMNIDGFLHSIQTGVANLAELVDKVHDLVNNRIDRNLKQVSNMVLVDLPSDESYSLDKFVNVQEKLVGAQAAIAAGKNLEVEEAVADLLVLIGEFPLEGEGAAKGVQPKPAGVRSKEAAKLREYYSRMFYRATLNATKRALQDVKKRVGSKSSGGFLFIDRPIFDVNVELSIPSVSLFPPLDDFQEAINRSCRAILGIGKSLAVWTTPADKAEQRTLFEALARDREIVTMVLLLTGSMEGAKRQVFDYLKTFRAYDWLWQGSKEAEYKEFMKREPTLLDVEAELKKYVDIEREISLISPVHNIGALSLETAPLKYSLRSEALSWKALFGTNLHDQALLKLEECTSWTKEKERCLKREIANLDDVRFAISHLKELRDRESSIEEFFEPVEEMYSILSRYEVKLDKEEVEQVNDLRFNWGKLLKFSGEVNSQLSLVQVDFKRDLLKNVKTFLADVQQLRSDWDTAGPSVPGLSPQEANERLKKFQQVYAVAERKYVTYSAGEELFGLPPTEYPELVKTKKEIDLLDKLYTLYITVNESVDGWRDMAWTDVGTEIPGILQRIQEFQGMCTKMPKDLRQWDAYQDLKHIIDEFSESLPLVQQLAHPAMRSRHWQALMDVTGEHLPVGTEGFKLVKVLDAGLNKYREEVEDIANSAVKELQVEDKLNAIIEDWSDEQLTFGEFKSRGQIILQAGPTAELMEKTEETLMGLGSMLASRYVVPFKSGVQEWVAKLSAVSDALEGWMLVQGMWIYLEAVFTSGDIAKQLPQESKRFGGIDKSWEKVMVKALETRNVVQYIYGNDGLQELLPHLLEQLEVCQKALSGYLDQKRAVCPAHGPPSTAICVLASPPSEPHSLPLRPQAFPRFYFVSDANLLEILSQGSNPQAIQVHLQSVFASVVRTDFDPSGTKITVLYDTTGENIALEKVVEMVGNVEEWLYKLLVHMQQAVNGVVQQAATDCETLATDEFTHTNVAQVSLIGIQIKWTMDCEDALYRAKNEKSVMAATAKKNLQRLNELVAMNLKPDSDLAQFGSWTRTKIETMITVDVHQRDVFDDMVKQKIRDIDHFEWQKQARFYWDPNKEVAQIVVADVEFAYCNEYLGVKERLVITPLTDRCYITLSQALGMCLGGAPAGPAGTGKTETVKDMGCTLGKYVVVFNCGDQMDFRIMGAILKGLSQSGCWGCFDEFNRIDLEVLSVVAQQVLSVLQAMKADKKSFQFTDGQVISLDKEVGFFITMNPGYAGRQELPENLKSLFRGVTMMVPDREIIMKVKLTACGYTHNAILAKKFNVLYRLCEEQLSKQPHYDFGLRNILAVLRTAGKSKREDLNAEEMLLLMRTLRDMNLSKYVAEDVPVR